ncbi:MAG: PAS domain-containing protein [Bacteroides sp.]|nr:PAS domain-containing protein [Bacteroides sp.]
MDTDSLKLPEWIFSMNCAITVVDKDCRIIYMNDRSRQTFANRGGAKLIGHNIIDYHNPRSIEIIRRLLKEGGSNAYTIEKEGVRKMIYQTTWHKDDGSIGGLVELSMIIPEDMPHYIRH